MTAAKPAFLPNYFHFCKSAFFASNPFSPFIYKGFIEVKPPIFAQKILPTVRSVLFPTHAIMRPMTLRIANWGLRIGDCRVAAPPRWCRVGPLARSVSSRRASTLPVAALWRAPQIIPAAMFEPKDFDATPRSRWLGGSSNPPLPFSAPSASLRAKFFAPWRLCVGMSSNPRISASIRGSFPTAAHLLYRCRNPKIKANQG